TVFLFLIPFIVIEWMGREEQFALAIFKKSNSSVINYSVYMIVAICILTFGNFSENQFIYFQF
ncbi:MAG TPA: hypothetical protein VK705_06690, partial [Ferruginibacter sp.]|nr:hypothetical protein [Ferruginibacter sp.]